MRDPEEYALCHWDLLSVTSTNPQHRFRCELNRDLHRVGLSQVATTLYIHAQQIPGPFDPIMDGRYAAVSGVSRISLTFSTAA